MTIFILGKAIQDILATIGQSDSNLRRFELSREYPLLHKNSNLNLSVTQDRRCSAAQIVFSDKIKAISLANRVGNWSHCLPLHKIMHSGGCNVITCDPTAINAEN